MIVRIPAAPPPAELVTFGTTMLVFCGEAVALIVINRDDGLKVTIMVLSGSAVGRIEVWAEEGVTKGNIETVSVAWLAKESGAVDKIEFDEEVRVDVRMVLLVGWTEEVDAPGTTLALSVLVVGDVSARVAEETLDVEVGSGIPALNVLLLLIPRILSATVLSVHPTNTPWVVFMGMAKHCVPESQTVVITKLPSELQLPILPAMQATWPLVQGDEKLRVAKRLLYPCASAKLALKMAGATEAVAAGMLEMMVGIWVMVAGAMELLWVTSCADDIEEEVTTEPVVDDLGGEILELLVVMTVVAAPVDWGPVDRKLVDVGTMVGSGMLSVLLSVNLGMLEARSTEDDAGTLSSAVGVWETEISTEREIVVDVVGESKDAPPADVSPWELEVLAPAFGAKLDVLDGIPVVVGIWEDEVGKKVGLLDFDDVVWRERVLGVNSGNELVGLVEVGRTRLVLEDVEVEIMETVDDECVVENSIGMIVSSPPAAETVKVWEVVVVLEKLLGILNSSVPTLGE
jgi:hypothetical protein